MLNKRMKKYVCMVKRNDDRGFSIVSMLLIMTVLSITLPLLSILLQKSSFEHDYDAISVQQFFMFLRNDLLEAKTYTVDEENLHLQLANGQTATISQYQQDIRRQVDGKGHEIYLADIQQLTFTSLPFGIRTTVTTLQGETYEKSIVFYE
ncbi:MAG TPA: ComGF family competence protein [Bacillota bacterium]|nr:ComGF family competence protein [Bacillota bacterium]